jgi:P27 family predicted phage terminase small subunit
MRLLMTRGRRPEPEAVQEAKGNPGRRKRASVKPTDNPADPVPVELGLHLKDGVPEILSEEGAVMWRKLAPDLVRMNFLRPSDYMAFARYCEYMVLWWDITRRIKSPMKKRGSNPEGAGVVYETNSNHGKMLRVNPLFVVRERIENRLTAFEDRFGLTPAARMQMVQRMAGQVPAGDLFTPAAGEVDSDSPPPAASAEENTPIGFLN